MCNLKSMTVIARVHLGSRFSIWKPTCPIGGVPTVAVCRLRRFVSLVGLLSVCVRGGDVIDVQDVIRRATRKMQSDWTAAPEFAFVQRDLTTSKGVTTRKTHRVFMILGSDYYMPIAISDEPFPADRQKLELQKLKEAVERRTRESPQQAQQRSAQYRKMREQNGILLREFTNAFDFTYSGEELANGRVTYVLEASPRAGYQPPNRTARVLTGMQGRLWIDKESFHWVKAEAEVLKSVSMFGVFARVVPGTRMELEMIPVTDAVWLISRFALDMRFSILWMKSAKASESTFSDYRPAADALAEALASENTAPQAGRERVQRAVSASFSRQRRKRTRRPSPAFGVFDAQASGSGWPKATY